MFLQKILPSEGLYCVAMLLPRGGFRHFFFDDIHAAQQHITALDNAGHTVYIAQATYSPEAIVEAQAHNKALPRGHQRSDRKKERSQDNAILLKNFFLDIDCGEKWPLKDKHEAVAALKKFIKETRLPFPAVISSGNGLYAHWILTEAIPAKQWRTIAFLLKKVVAEYSPAIGGDATRTADSASVLRPEGATNRKPGKTEKKVKLLKDVDPIQFTKFADLLGKAAARKKINREMVLAPKTSVDINAEFFAGLERQSVPSDADKVADNCAQLALMRSTRGDITEPLWYACIGVLAHCDDGDTVIHDWSSGHPQYNPTETDAKISQWRSADLGPSTCATLGATNAAGCVGCKNINKVKSPIILGRPDPLIKALPETQCGAPDGFRRAEDGLFVERDEQWVKFYDRDLYVDRLAYDESLGFEVMTIKHDLPYEGDMECTIRSSMVNDPKLLLTTLSDNHIKVVGVKEKKYMTAYLESYQAKLQRSRNMTMLLCQMGWKKARNDKRIFTLGRNVYWEDGTVDKASLAKNIPKAAEAFHSKGSLDKWVEATSVLDKPGMEPFAFALLTGFGAPLMKFTGFPGAVVSLTGESGAGKTLMLRWVQSIWGYHNDLIMLRDDTKNAQIARVGVYGNLPACFDEVTNMPGMDVSDLVYGFTQGREKLRLTKSAQERRVINQWNTIGLTSSNTSLIDKLSEVKHNATAEINRVFEYAMYENKAFTGQTTTGIYWMIHENYGRVGEEFVKYVVRMHPDQIKVMLDTLRERLDIDAHLTGEERFLGAIASVNICGGAIAKKLGLLNFDILRVRDWAVNTLIGMRENKLELTGSAIDIIGQFLDAHVANTLIVSNSGRKGPTGCTIIQPPRGSLDIRHEADTHLVFISRAVLKRWIAKGYGSYTQTKNDLMGYKALLSPNRRKSLGAGTYFGGASQPVWVLDLKCQALGSRVHEFIEIAETLKKDPVNLEVGL